MRTSYPAPHSNPGPSLISTIPTIVIHPPSPGQQLPQLHPGMNMSEDESVSRGYYDDCSVSGRLEKEI